MGFIRGALITIFSIILFFSLLLMNFSLSLSLSLQYDTLQPALNVSVRTLLDNYFAAGDILSEEQKDYMQNVTYTTDDFIDQIYYGEYNCEFWQCVKNSPIPFVLLSEKAKDYWAGKFLLLLGLSLLIFGLTFLLSRKRSTTFIVTGVIMILSALPFRNLNWILKFVKGDFSSLLSVFFTQAHSVFIILLIFGILFIVIGILCKIFGWKLKFTKDKTAEESSKDNLQKKKKK